MPRQRGDRGGDGPGGACCCRDPASAWTGAGRERALEAALGQLVPSWQQDYPDRPDAHVTAVRRMPAAEARTAPYPEALDPGWCRRCAPRGIAQLYTHQAAAVGTTRSPAGTSSSRRRPRRARRSATTCRSCNAILADPSTRALYLFPTKALAQDQLAELRRPGAGAERGGGRRARRLHLRRRHAAGRAAGDPRARARRAHQPRHAARRDPAAPPAVGAALREPPLHRHRRAARLPRRLRQPPRQHAAAAAARLPALRVGPVSSSARRRRSPTRASWPSGSTERPFELVDESGAPRGEKFFLFVNPPIVNRQLGIRRSYTPETRRVSLEFLRRGLQVIVFAQSRLVTEILTTYLKEDVPGPAGGGRRGARLPRRLPAEPAPRDREAGCATATVRAVVSTNALELGIDIGALDVAVLAGYPGTIAATWQRAGRAGRRAGHVGGGAGGLERAAGPVRRRATRRTSSTRRPSTR